MPRKSWWARLPFGIRMMAGTTALLLAIGGGAAGVAYLTKERPQRAAGTARTSSIAAPPAAPANGQAALDPATAAGLGDAVKAATGDRTSEEADRTATRDPDRTAVRAAEERPDQQPAQRPVGQPANEAPVPVDAPVKASPVITTKTVSETRALPFRTRFVRDPSMPRGTSREQTPGVDGVQAVRWLVTYADGRETDRRPIDSKVTRAPQPRVIALGSQGRRGDWGGGGWGRPRECDADLEPCIHLGEFGCPEQVQESSDELTVLGEGVSALTPDGALADLATPCR